MEPEIADWLRQLLTTIGYRRQDRLYGDVEAVLKKFKNFLVPKAETYTHDNGRTQYLLSLIGTVPIIYQAASYNIPVAIWIPITYPEVAPIVFVTPTALMLVKAGDFVDVSGRVYHPYLAYWSDHPNYNLVGLIHKLQEVFSQEPPVYAKSPAEISQQQHQQQQQRHASPTPGSYPSPSLTYNGSSLNNQSSFSPRTNGGSPTTQQQHQYQSSIQQQQQQQMYNTTNSGGGTANHNSNNSQSTLGSDGSGGGSKPIGGNGSSGSQAIKIAAQAPPELNPQQAQLYTKLQSKLHEFYAESSREMDSLLVVNRQLNTTEMRTRQELENLRDLFNKIEYNKSRLEGFIEQVNGRIEAVSKMPEEPVDEMICGSSVVHNQLFELVAEENAIEDTIYYLGKALSKDMVELSVYMKHLRNLSREQFMKKALIKKVKAQLGLTE